MTDPAPSSARRVPPPRASSAAPGAEFERLVEIMRLLRSPDGCPWDREQTLASLAPYVLEEAYEVIDAIERGDLEELRDEVGDLIFEGVFLAQVASDEGAFNIGEAVRAIGDKLIRRHPHVFATPGTSPDLDSPAEVKEQWDEIKTRERADAGRSHQSALDGIPRALPAVLTACEMGRHAAKVGFDWPDAAGVLAKVREELDELGTALAAGDRSHAAEELGDLFFSLANLARQLDIDPEGALRAANRKFERRFRAMELDLAERGQHLETLSVDEMEAAWNRVKDAEPRPGGE